MCRCVCVFLSTWPCFSFALTLALFCASWHINACFYLCTSSAISSVLFILVICLESRLGVYQILPALWNESTVTLQLPSSGAFCWHFFTCVSFADFFLLLFFYAAVAALVCFHVISSHTFSFLRVVQSRRWGFILPDPRYAFFWKNLKEKGGGGT